MTKSMKVSDQPKAPEPTPAPAHAGTILDVLLETTYPTKFDATSERWCGLLLECSTRLDLAAAVCAQRLDRLDDDSRSYGVETVIRDTQRVLTALRYEIEGATVLPRGEVQR